jgi:hypothetical protein
MNPTNDLDLLSKFKHVIDNMQVLGKLVIGDKLYDLETDLHIQSSGYFNSISRMVSSNSRARSLRIITRDIDIALVLLNLLIESKYLYNSTTLLKTSEIKTFTQTRETRLNDIDELIGVLARSATGLQNLAITYIGDPSTVEQIRELFTRVNSELGVHAQILIEGHGNIKLGDKSASDYIM